MIWRWLAAEGLRWSVAFWRVQAYLSSHMDDQLAVAEFESLAGEALRKLDVLSVQP